MSAEQWRSGDELAYQIGKEEAIYEAVTTLIAALVVVAAPIWHQGDGEGGVVLDWLLQAAEAEGLRTSRTRQPPKVPNRRPISPGKQAKVFARDGLRCVFCKTVNGLTIDHIQPVSKGGTDDLDNLQTLCKSCNSSKGDR